MTNGDPFMNPSVASIRQTALHHFELAANRLNLEPAVRNRLADPKEQIELSINPALPGGRVVHARAFVVIHNDAIGPAKGGIRMTDDVTRDDIMGLAMEMTWKTSIIGVPFGGGKSGISFESDGLSPIDKEAIIRSFTRAARRHIGPELYIPAPDMGTNEEDMAHIRDCIAYSEGRSITAGCFVTGKPLILGGIAGRREATGKGVVYTVLALCERLGINVAEARIAVQGFGNVGSVAATEIAKHGATIVGISDITGAVANPDGLDLDALTAHYDETGGLHRFPGGEEIPRDALLELDCDILIPAAAGSQITDQNAPRIKARIVAEGANAPTTPNADTILNESGTLIIPDILCNAGGVFVSFLEYTQETQREQMTEEQVEARLADRMRRRFNEVFDRAAEHRQVMREAAMDIAVARVVEATRVRGILP